MTVGPAAGWLAGSTARQGTARDVCLLRERLTACRPVCRSQLRHTAPGELASWRVDRCGPDVLQRSRDLPWPTHCRSLTRPIYTPAY